MIFLSPYHIQGALAAIKAGFTIMQHGLSAQWPVCSLWPHSLLTLRSGRWWCFQAKMEMDLQTGVIKAIFTSIRIPVCTVQERTAGVKCLGSLLYSHQPV